MNAWTAPATSAGCGTGTLTLKVAATIWISYANASGGGSIRGLQGSHEPGGGCRFSLESSLAPGQNAVQVDEVAFNPETCQARLAVSA